MTFLIFEYLFLTMIFLTLYFVGFRQNRKKGIIPVKDLRHLCTTDDEKRLYDGLINHGVYATPSVKLGACSIPIALEQFNVAIFLYPKRRSAILSRLIIKQKELYLRSTGWKVFKFSDDAIKNNLEFVVQVVMNNTKIKKI
ncbi:hypothetical protein AWH56_014665 [Anaerobacillus isosaccharinicus]|uniref:DUF559 domain-containing protein n=1 Tax=Anaerobacillus isosaccharinicus TaxID=1532552 RepID=A0A1S2MGM7_9BACI|nr:hypothetical protein [Anaerobacillus isosaccharinicus]MBA5587861.1 hypothetical protein [Anaerobacillus isosaccharinicus]QOY33985.1 hypothetical protein AWH56_014665 [Anaerobacillus isosaccharinicus]